MPIAMSEMTHGVLIVDSELRIVFFNRKCAEILNLAQHSIHPGLPLRAALDGAVGAIKIFPQARSMRCGGSSARLSPAEKRFSCRTGNLSGWVDNIELPTDQRGRLGMHVRKCRSEAPVRMRTAGAN